MVRLSVCIEMFWPDLPYAQRVAQVAAAGIGAYEFWNYSDKDLPALQAAAQGVNIEGGSLQVAAFVCEPGFALTGPAGVDVHVTGVQRAAAVGRQLGASTLIVTAGNIIAGESWEMTRRRVLRKLKAMAEAAKQEEVTLCLEPLNVHDDHPGYWLTTMAQAADLVEEVGLGSLKILYDIYHQQITEGSILANLRKYAALIGHIHVAGAPGRGNLVGGDLDYRTIFAAIDAAGYRGYTGLEFRPTGATAEALAEAVLLAQGR
jgi:hydroxypyruvate isomerase